jgi:hypothetical protein
LNLPDLYLIGAPKAGTTSIAAWLGGHPDVFWSTPKEPFYWAFDYPRLRHHYGIDTLEKYSALFSSPPARSSAVRAEGSTVYLYSERAVGAILEAVPDPRFLVCLRSPSDLVVSYHRTQVTALNEDEPDFAAAWSRACRREPPPAKALDAKLVDYVTIGALGKSVEALLRRVDRSRVHFILFDDLVSDPLAAWMGLLDFLSLPDPGRLDLAAHNPSTHVYRSALIRRLTHRPPEAADRAVAAFRSWSRRTRFPGVRQAKALMWRHVERPTINSRTREELTEHFSADVELLERLLGRDLSSWRSIARHDPESDT